MRQPGHPDILEAKNAVYISARNKDVKKINDERMPKLEGLEFISMKNYKPRIEKDTDRIAKTSFVDIQLMDLLMGV